MQLKRSTSCGLAECRCGLRCDRTPVAGLQNETTAAVHAGFRMKGLEVLGAQPARIGIERLVLQLAAAQQLHLRSSPQGPEAEMGTGKPAADNQDPFAGP